MPNWRVSWDAALAFSICEPASDELVDDNLLLKDFFVYYSSHMLQPQALYIFYTFIHHNLFNMLKTSCNERKRSQAHTYKLYNDER